jgi:hypothetical protein
VARLNLTLDDATFRAIGREARRHKVRVATHARQLLQEALAHRERAERRKAWATAYRADRADARTLSADFEPGQLEIMGDEEDLA